MIKLNAIEKIFYKLNEAFPFNTFITATLNGHIDKQKLTIALKILKKKHELLNVSINIDSKIDPVFSNDNTNPIPLVQIDNNLDYESKLLNELHTPFNLHKDSLVKCFMYANEYDDVTKIALVSSHIIADGMSIYMMIKDLLSLYEASDNSVQIHPQLKHPNSPLQLYPLTNNKEELDDAKKENFKDFNTCKPENSKKSLYPIRNCRTNFKRYQFNETQTNAIKTYAAKNKLSIQSLIKAILCLTLSEWIKEANNSSEEMSINCRTLINLRPYYTPPLQNEQMGNWISKVSFDPFKTTSQSLLSTAKNIHETLKDVLKNKTWEDYVYKPSFNTLKGIEFADRFSKKQAFISVSNLGDMDKLIKKQYTTFKLVDIFHCPAVQGIYANKWGFAVPAVTFNSRLSLIYTYVTPYQSENQIDEFISRTLKKMTCILEKP